MLERREQPNQILFVDDEPRVLDGIRRLMRSEAARWTPSFATSAADALALAREIKPDIIVSDVKMPQRDGLELLGDLASDPELNHIPVIILTGSGDVTLKRHALELGAVDLLTKPLGAEDLRARLVSALRLKRYEDQLRQHAADLEACVAQRTQELEMSRIEIALRLAMAGECRDSDTGRHVVRVAHASRVIGEAMGLDRETCDQLLLASPLHDIGKVGIPDHVLRKAGTLAPSERAVMQQHCRIGYDILRGPLDFALTLANPHPSCGPAQNELLDTAATIALSHHERWDGTGYPARLAGEAIPLEARIVAAADALDALASVRPYKPAVPLDMVRRMLAADRGLHFDPAVSDAVERAWHSLNDVLDQFSDTCIASTDAA